MISYPTPKINIGLNILGKRPDGYHDIDTLFYPVDAFRDKLAIEPSREFSIEIIGADWPPETDLCARAWALLRDEYGIPPVKISLTKGIPVGAGLGGGSADCAHTLRLLNSLFEVGLSSERLEELAGRLGSDCAFFIRNIPQWGSGRGEILSPAVIDLSLYQIKFLVPQGEKVSTKEAYGGLSGAGLWSIPLREALSRPVGEWKDTVFNDFEQSVFPSHPRIAAAKEQLYRDGALYASMTGSGSAVYGIFK